jgi:hypothetical protein
VYLTVPPYLLPTFLPGASVGINAHVYTKAAGCGITALFFFGYTWLAYSVDDKIKIKKPENKSHG